MKYLFVSLLHCKYNYYLLDCKTFYYFFCKKRGVPAHKPLTYIKNKGFPQNNKTKRKAKQEICCNFANNNR